jgi:hypothetical protein
MRIGFENVYLRGASVGIKSERPVHIRGRKLHFDDVETPFDLAPGSTADLEGTRISRDPKKNPTPKTGSRIGWTPALTSGPPLPSFCPNCKTVFASANYKFSGPYFWLWGNEDTCPECGYEHAKLAEGIFDLTTEAVKVLTAPDMTHAMLRSIGSIMESLLSGAMTERDATSELEAISQPVANLLAVAGQHGPTAAMYVTLVIAVITLMYQIESVKLQRESNSTSDIVIEHVLSEMSEIKLILQENSKENSVEGDGREQTGSPPSGEAPAERPTGSLGEKDPPNQLEPRLPRPRPDH